MLGTFEAANAALSAVMGQPDYFKRMLEPEHIASTVATVLPFEALGFPAAVRRTLDVRRAMDVHQGLWFDKLTQQDAADREAQKDVLTRQREEEPEVKDVVAAPAMEQPQGPELITHSAFVPDPTHPENIEYGAHHPEILDRLGVKGFEQRESRNTPQFGYKTTHRPFITREEASALMNRTGQKLDLEAPIQPHSDEIPSATGKGTVAEQGDWHTVYHGSPEVFDKVRIGKVSGVTGTHIVGQPKSFYVTEHPKFASHYAGEEPKEGANVSILSFNLGDPGVFVKR